MTLLKLSLASACLLLSSIAYSQELSVFNDGFSKSYFIDDHKISRAEFLYVLKEDRNAEILWDKANKYSIAAIGFSAISMGFAAWTLKESAEVRRTRNQNLKPLTAPIIGMLGSAIASVTFSVKRNRTQRTAILAYNKSVNISDFEPIIDSDKMGIVLHF